MNDRWEDLRGCILHTADALTAVHAEQARRLTGLRGLRRMTLRLLALLRSAMYPQIFGADSDGPVQARIGGDLRQAAILLRSMLRIVQLEDAGADGIVCRFLQSLPGVARALSSDVRAAYEGDPAAESEEEVMLAYPAFEAISIYRLAHQLYELDVPLIPRMMTEQAHRTTGIDIHPGAEIGSSFFIDHGTGVVIGETCTIGEHVKLYQGVTLGAKSFETDEHGNPVKGIKRHPDIGDHVVIYAGATILGGGTVIGDHCIIGGNVWLTRSVGPGNTIYNSQGES
ncbi:MAG: serine O-acetyltransferase EpsC [Clostridiaceae bacterium]|nr:serine O-acetyltransferase EpsC [Clostridiaceae bacterium]